MSAENRGAIFLCIVIILTIITSTCYTIVYLSIVDFTSDKCPTIPRKDFYEIEEVEDAKWSWKYAKGDYRVQCRCISINHDADVYYKDKLVVRTDAKTLSFTSKTPILDCKNKLLILMKIDNSFDSKTANKTVSYEFKLKNGNVIAYADPKRFLSDNIKIKNIDGKIIARLEKVKPLWKIYVYDQNHTMSDPAILLAIVGKRSFSEYKGKIDACNTMFWFFFIIAIVC